MQNIVFHIESLDSSSFYILDLGVGIFIPHLPTQLLYAFYFIVYIP